VSVWGGQRMATNRLTQGTPVRVGLIQGNILQADKWNPARAGMIVDRFIQLTRQAAANGAEFLLWPESSTPFYFQDDAGGDEIRSLVRELGRPLLLGSDEMEPGTPNRLYNSAFMLDPVGATAAVYRKIHLVPFGEYVPFQRALFFVGPLVEAVSAFTAGDRVTMLPVREHMVSTAICYEVTYPARRERPSARGVSCSRPLPTTPGTANRRPRISTSKWPRCAPSSRAATWSGPPTPASAASSIRTGAC